LAKSLRRPAAVIETLSMPTRVHDETIKLCGYQLIDFLQTIIFINPDGEVVTLHERLEGRE
jgi:hypothetical protein